MSDKVFREIATMPILLDQTVCITIGSDAPPKYCGKGRYAFKAAVGRTADRYDRISPASLKYGIRRGGIAGDSAPFATLQEPRGA